MENGLPDFVINGLTVFDEKVKLNELAKHFTQNIDNLNVCITSPIENSSSADIPILSNLTVSISEVIETIKNLPTNKPSGHDRLPAKFYKSCMEEIAPHLTAIINDMIQNGYFPSQLKLAEIVPLYKKKGDRSSPKSYRPISILPTTTKIIDKLLYDKLINFLEKNNILMDQQHGYRKHRSTQSAITILTDEVKLAAEKKEMTGAIFFDFVSAFDRIRYTSLLQKLYDVGIRGNLILLLQSYFTDRKLIVKKCGVYSQTQNMIHGCAQGSSLSGLTFSMYINDTKDIFTDCNFLYYADDLVLFAHGKTIEEITQKLQNDTNNLIKWCYENGMEINISKTKCMLFHTKRAKFSHYPTVFIENACIETVTNFKYLGLVLNETLDFQEHFETVCENMTKRTFMLHRQKRNFNPRWRYILSTSLVLSLLDYCLPIWGEICDGKRKRLNNIMHRTAKLVVSAKQPHKHTKLDRLEQLGWLLFHERYELLMMTFTYKHIWKESSLNSCFPHFKKQKCDRTTRQENNFDVPLLKTSTANTTFLRRGIAIWNSIPNEIKRCDNFNMFDINLRKHIMSKRVELDIYF